MNGAICRLWFMRQSGMKLEKEEDILTFEDQQKRADQYERLAILEFWILRAKTAELGGGETL